MATFQLANKLTTMDITRESRRLGVYCSPVNVFLFAFHDGSNSKMPEGRNRFERWVGVARGVKGLRLEQFDPTTRVGLVDTVLTHTSK